MIAVIQNRRGAYSTFDPSRLQPGEFAVVQSGDTTTDTGMSIYLCISAGNVLRIVTSEELLGYESSLEALTTQVENALGDIATALAKIAELESVEENIQSTVNTYLDAHPELLTNVADGSITTIKLADLAVTDAKLANSSVTTAKLADEAVSGSKIADGAVSNDKLANNSVGTTNIVDNSITTAKIVDEAITEAKLADDVTTFTEAGTIANIASEETLPTILGKIKHWFTNIFSINTSASTGTTDGDLYSILTTLGWTGVVSNGIIGIKALFTKIMSHFKIVQLLSSTTAHPIVTGWAPSYTDVPNLSYYNTVYVRVFVYGTVIILTFPRFDNAPYYTQYFDNAYLASGGWTYGRLRVDVDWQNNRVGLSAINGEMSQMGIQGIWGTNKIS